MNGKQHEAIGLTSLFASSLFLAWNRILEPVDLLYYMIAFYICTKYITPDLDTHSRSTKRLGLIGSIINVIFKHRGVLHNPFMWAVLFGVSIWYSGFLWLVGGLAAVELHILFDWMS